MPIYTNFNEIDHQKKDDDSSSVVVASDPAFEKNGYGDVMPQLVYWCWWPQAYGKPVVPTPLTGVLIVNNYTDSFFRLFLGRKLAQNMPWKQPFVENSYENPVIVN